MPRGTIILDARLIPASAGSTNTTASIAMCHFGSSPRLRGALAGGNHAACVTGLIPASAGSTVCNTSTLIFCWAHPRVCGEHTC